MEGGNEKAIDYSVVKYGAKCTYNFYIKLKFTERFDRATGRIV